MQVRTLGTIIGVVLAAVLLAAVTWVIATRTAAETGQVGVLQTAAGGLKENFLTKQRWSRGQVGVDPESTDTTLRDYFLSRQAWSEIAGSDGDRP